MLKTWKENRGVVLIVSLMVAVVLSTLSAAYVTSSIVQSQAVQREKDSLKSFYAAERGVEYAFVESRNHGWNWHIAAVDKTDSDGDGDISELNSLGNPGVTLTGAAYNVTTGCYELQTPSGLVEVKTYADPDKNYETWVLSRSGSKIIRFKLTRRSLYKYFFYYPTDKYFGYFNIDGKGVGGIYVNGNIALHSTIFTNITELSTNKTGAISKYKFQYNAPYILDDKIGTRDGKAPLPSLDPGHIYSVTNPYPWQISSWPPNAWLPYDWWNVARHFYYDEATNYKYKVATVNGTDLPITLNTAWNWDKYSGTDKSANPVGSPELSVQFYDKDGNLATAAYWSSLESTYTASYFDPAFWDTKTYQRTSETVSVNYLNTDKQANDWIAWLDPDTGPGKNLNGIVKEKSTGAYDTAVLNIEANYSQLAKENGLYIGKDGGGNLDVWVNGSETDTLPSWIADNVEFFNTVRPKVVSGSPTKENVLQLDIQASLTSSQIPNNGIIYISHKNLRLVNGEKLPRSLTVVSPYNIYIKGNYNTHSDWQPAAVISNSLVYTLSNNFNDPQHLPATIYPREYPYELQYVDLRNFPQPSDTPSQRETKLIALEQECENFFGLASNFDIHSTGSQPADLSVLQTKIRQKHNADYTNNMPNRVNSDTIMKVAIASPYEPTGYQLERWCRESWSTESSYSRQLTIKGAFIKLGRSWSDSSDVPSQYNNKRTGTQNLAGLDPITMEHSPRLICDVNPFLEYEEQFATGGTPPGDLPAGSQSVWQEIASNDYNFSHHTAQL